MKLQHLIFFLLFAACNSPAQDLPESKAPIQSRDSIISEHLQHGAWKHSYYSREWQTEIDKGLAKDSTIAYLWQQKGMPYIKQGKYELAMRYIDKAVQYDPAKYLDYRAFLKCIFGRRYTEAIADFEACKARFGQGYVQDHAYDFYIALCRIQLNEFVVARDLLQGEIDRIEAQNGPDWVHHLDVFYLGICHYEMGDYEAAVRTFDRALALYPKFSDVQYYKALSLQRLGDKAAAQELYKAAKANGEAGYTINEDNAIYERYPYQVRWHNHK